jgi:predicted GIY-YIG superfamily endonuclease
MHCCIKCGKPVKNPAHDLCFDCWDKNTEQEDSKRVEDHFEDNLGDNEIHTVYIMFYAENDKIGYTKDLNSRLLEIKRKYPQNELVYFREFVKETEARRFEKWLKSLSERELHKFISGFQDKIKKVKII